MTPQSKFALVRKLLEDGNRAWLLETELLITDPCDTAEAYLFPVDGDREDGYCGIGDTINDAVEACIDRAYKALT